MARYAYTGSAVMLYQSYMDDDTGRMLVASPGESYSMSAVDSGAVPPNDGRWADDSGPPSVAFFAAEPAADVAAPASVEGGEE